MEINKPERAKCLTRLPEGWVTAIMASCLYFLIGNGMATIGMLMVEFVEYFDCTKADVSLVGGALGSLNTIGALIFGEFLAQFGPRVTGAFGTILVSGGYVGAAFSNSITALFVTLGLIAGLGNSCFILAGGYSIQRYCTNWRSSAAGIMLTGVSIGVMVFPPWTEFLIREYNWRGALLINGGLILHGFLFSMLLGFGGVKKSTGQVEKQDNIEKQEDGINSSRDTAMGQEMKSKCNKQGLHLKRQEKSTEKTKDISMRVKMCTRMTQTASAYINLMKRPKIMFMVLCCIMVQFGHLGPYAYLPMRARKLGFSKEKAAMLVATLGVIGVIGRVGSGFVGNYFFKKRILLYGLSSIIVGASAILSVFVINDIGLFAYGVSFALFSGFYMALRSVVMVDLIGITMFPQLMAITLPLIGIFQLISISTSGMLIDATSKIEVPFLYLGAVQVLGGVLSILLWRIDSRGQREKSQVQKLQRSEDDQDIQQEKHCLTLATQEIQQK